MCLSSTQQPTNALPAEVAPSNSRHILGEQHTLDQQKNTTQLGHNLKDANCMLRLPIHWLNRAAKDIRDSKWLDVLLGLLALARNLRAACADFVVSAADC